MKTFGAYAWWIGWALVLFMGSSFALAAASFTIGLPLTTAVWMGAAVLTVTLLARAARELPGIGRLPGWMAVTATTALLIVAMASVARQCDDASGDGHWFHQEGVIQLAENWNPFYFDADLDLTESDLGDTRKTSMWLASYPKALWIVSSLVYMTTGDLEAGKVVHWLLGWAAMGTVLWLLLDIGVPAVAALALAFVSAWTPVVITQLYSYYLDGDVHCLMVIALASGVRLLRGRDWSTALVLFASLVLLINAKLLGVAYAALIGLGLGGWALVRQRAALRWLIGVFCAAGLLGIVWFGYSPYVRNQRERGHFLYPAMGPNRIFDNALGPRDFPALNRAQDLLTTIYARPEVFPIFSGATRPKPLLSVTEEDLAQFRHWPDVAVGGYGVLFGEALLGAGLVMALLLWRPASWWPVAAVAFAAVMIVGSTLMKEFAWYARYNPQISLIPVIVAAAAFQHTAGFAGRLRRGLAYGVALLLMVNSVAIGRSYFIGQVELTQHFRRQVRAAVEASQESPVVVSFRHLRSFRVYWHKAGVRFREVRRPDLLPCQKPVTIDMMHAVWCPPER
ncbi:MAG: hypothetical protein JNN08_27685 [Bryobacterales bacterium]|nr:hypothetical protein [Bryobacterales bacterium]